MSSDWKRRLAVACEGVLTFSESLSMGRVLAKGESFDKSAIVETVEKDGRLLEGRLWIGVPPDREELVPLKLGYWTLLFFTAVIPDWRGAVEWGEQAAGRVAATGEPAEVSLGSHRVLCRYHATSRMVELELMVAGAELSAT